MRPAQSLILKLVILPLLVAPSLSTAQTTHVVQVTDFAFTPRHITIQPGDTVRWINGADGIGGHNLIGENYVFAYEPIETQWTYEFTFNEDGEYDYYCEPHRPGMVGSVTVQGNVDPPDPPFSIDPGHSGNWWNGVARNGEGAQVEVSDAGGGEFVFVVTFYSYGPAGGQIFLIGVGTPVGDTVEVDVFITDGPAWGDGFDPDDVVETQWGSGTFTAESCELIHMSLMPNATYQAEGYSNLEYDLARLTTPSIACPYEG